MGNNMSILIIGYDGYNDLWNDCIFLLKKYCGKCPFEIVFVNNIMDVSWEGITVLHAGKDAEWSRKVQVGLTYINTDYICLLLEDFFVGEKIKTDEVLNLLDLMTNKRIDYVKLVDMNNAAKDHNKSIQENRQIHGIRYCDDYGVSLQPSIWRKEFLTEKVGTENYNAWIFEFNRVKESQPKNKKYMNNALFDTRNILNIQHGVIQGKYLPLTIKFFEKKGIKLNVQREIMKVSQYRKIRLISFCKSLIPLWIRPFVKKNLEKIGMKFVSTMRDK